MRIWVIEIGGMGLHEDNVRFGLEIRLTNCPGFPGILPEFSTLSRSPGVTTSCPAFLDMHDLLNFNYLILLNRIIKVSCNYSYGTSCSHSLKGD